MKRSIVKICVQDLCGTKLFSGPILVHKFRKNRTIIRKEQMLTSKEIRKYMMPLNGMMMMLQTNEMQ